MQAGAGRPALADQERAARLCERRGLRPHHREMPPLCAASEETLGPIGRDELHAVDPAVDVLQRHDKPAACVHAQRERRGLLGDQIGMAVRGRACAGPDPGGARCGIVRLGWCRSGMAVRTGLGTCRVRYRRRFTRLVRRHGPWCGGLANWTVTRAHADPVGDPVGRILACQAEIAADEIREPTATPFLVVEPHARPRAADDDREAALAPPAPFLARAKGRLAQKLHRKLRHAGAQLGIEGSPVPPAHRRPRGACACTPVGFGAAAAWHRGWRRRADTGAAEPDEGRRCPRFCRASDHPRDVGTGPPGRTSPYRKGVTPSGKALDLRQIMGGPQQVE